MRQLNLTLSRLLISGCLLFIATLSVSAQHATPNPGFLPLKSQQGDVVNDMTPTSTPEELPQSVDNTETTPDVILTEPIEKTEHHILKRPITLDDARVHWADRTYPYGSTQWNTKQVHLGVDFVNPRYTPVYAAEAGTVIFAESDSKFPVGPYQNYYGNVIIIAHENLSLDGEPIFTLYGHLDRVEVREGQEVTSGERIGRVGSSGIALGAHLHFEVRVIDPFDYRFTRNPELWLQYYVNHGMIAGFVHDSDGNPVYGQRLVVRSKTVNREVFTYGDRVNSDPAWQENFTVSDLPADDYEIVMLNQKGLVVYRENFTVEAYKTTFVDILLEE